ncbi:Capsular polysaccharide export system inner membrane protein KpsE [Cupriavidus sp. U2]|nr:Capsular polysaccharide export system inner membrane protein KpsE [Cupriavidus sp. U2]
MLETVLKQPEGTLSTKLVNKVVQRVRNLDRLLVCTVIIPTILATVYYGLIASDVYISESRFVVRSPEKESQASLVGALLQSTGFSRSQDDIYAVNDYVLSRDALSVLNQDDYFLKAYSTKDADFIGRFPAFDFDRSFEGLFRYYKKQVDVTLDSTSSITTLTVDAFKAEDARRINQLLLEQGEQLVNRMNDRARRDMVEAASEEVARAEARVKAAAVAVSGYRSDQSIFDPDRQSALQLQQASGIQESLVASRTQLAQLQAIAPQNPQIPVLKNKIATLEAEMAKASGSVVGRKGSFAGKAPAYERLILEREFAEKQLASAMTSLETSRSQARRKQLYLERISQPSLPDKAIEPRRIRGIITVFLVGMIMWGVLALLISAVREHKD